MTDENEKKDEKKLSQHDPSRRRFLKGVGVAGAGAALADHFLTEEGKAAALETNEVAQSQSGDLNITLDVNGQKRNVTVEPRTTLLNALRNNLDPGLTGPKLVCDMGTCGGCTVLLNDKPAYSCLMLAVDAAGKKVTTVEGLGTPTSMNGVQKAFVENDALMCGFCTPGFITTISAYLKKNANPTIEQVREACKGNFCRCGTYPRVFEAALAAAKSSAGRNT